MVWRSSRQSSCEQRDEQVLWGTRDAAALAAADLVTPFPLSYGRKGAGATAARPTLQLGCPQLDDPGKAMGAVTTTCETYLTRDVKLGCEMGLVRGAFW